MKTPYYSQDPRYKTPFGAVTAGTPVSFKLYLPLDCSRAWLIYHKDGKAEIWQDVWRTLEGDQNGWWWECIITPNEAGLYFYHFYFDTPYGHNPLTCGKGGAGIMQADGPEWQLTVYRADFQTPDWLKGGIMYQIFPDRFCASGTPKQNVPAERYLYSEFVGQPAFNVDKTEQEPCRLNNDYWCGDLKGIESKLPYFKELGVTCLYLNPIFEAHSNHRYNTADYKKIDPLLGTEQDFKDLCAAAHAVGIRILLDGVFSHTGSDSVYFNKQLRYEPNGAVNRPDSPYRSWYTFINYPEKYHSWWGFQTLPEVNETDPDYLSFITGHDGVLAYWMNRGADGWRLDVADELPDLFLDYLRRGVKANHPQGMILGEVWEDATTKISYGNRRSYLLGTQLDSVMNYPFANAVLDFVRNGDGNAFLETVMTVAENYPAPALHTLMNHLGTHDTKRLITALAGEAEQGRDRAWQSKTRLHADQYKRGEAMVQLATLLQYTLPGVPCVYYGDELGMEGYGDPFNRAPMAWNTPPCPKLKEWYKRLGAWRTELPMLKEGDMVPLYADQNTVAYMRVADNQALLVAVNRGNKKTAVSLPRNGKHLTTLLGECTDNDLLLPPMSGGLVLFDWL
ncbi:MAG: glycoside hydrolase family 13 protein [Clostridia bacterium]|nr:glycoside hydrolase family 13 protein [Clostridia bacterium]